MFSVNPPGLAMLYIKGQKPRSWHEKQILKQNRLENKSTLLCQKHYKKAQYSDIS